MASELPVPKPVTVPHEITAVAMAHGYTMVTGRPQVVMVHTIAGTANAVGGLINASRTQIPMLFTAGRTPTTESGLKGPAVALFIGRKSPLIRALWYASGSSGTTSCVLVWTWRALSTVPSPSPAASRKARSISPCPEKSLPKSARALSTLQTHA